MENINKSVVKSEYVIKRKQDQKHSLSYAINYGVKQYNVINFPQCLNEGKIDLETVECIQAYIHLYQELYDHLIKELRRENEEKK